VQEEEWQLHVSKKETLFKIPGMWAEDNTPTSTGLVRNIPPVVVELNTGVISVSQRQYYIPRKAQIGIQKHLDRLPQLQSTQQLSLYTLWSQIQTRF
jgi:hypothetical protein